MPAAAVGTLPTLVNTSIRSFTAKALPNGDDRQLAQQGFFLVPGMQGIWRNAAQPETLYMNANVSKIAGRLPVGTKGVTMDIRQKLLLGFNPHDTVKIDVKSGTIYAAGANECNDRLFRSTSSHGTLKSPHPYQSASQARTMKCQTRLMQTYSAIPIN